MRAVLAHKADVVVLTEVREGSRSMRADLEAEGYHHHIDRAVGTTDNGVWVFSRRELEARPLVASPDRWIEAGLRDAGLTLVGVHLRVERKTRHDEWEAALAAAGRIRDEPALLIGDFNTGRHGVDEAGSTFSCAKHFEALLGTGWTDVWRHFGPKDEYSWFNTRKGGTQGNGFRIDHAFASPSLLPRVTRCWYSHGEREAHLSDHSLLSVDIADTNGENEP